MAASERCWRCRGSPVPSSLQPVVALTRRTGAALVMLVVEGNVVAVGKNGWHREEGGPRRTRESQKNGYLVLQSHIHNCLGGSTLATCYKLLERTICETLFYHAATIICPSYAKNRQREFVCLSVSLSQPDRLPAARRGGRTPPEPPVAPSDRIRSGTTTQSAFSAAIGAWNFIRRSRRRWPPTI